MAESIVVIGYSLSKTGSTSLLRHVANNFLPRHYFSYGAATNAQRRKNGRPQLEELSNERRDEIRYLVGHGIGEGVLSLFAHRPSILFTVVRDPFARFVSVYKHRRRTMPESEHPSPRELFDEQPSNPFATEIANRFGGGDPWKGIARFDYILVTEYLDEQSSFIMKYLGLPGISERARVYPETPCLGDITPEEVYERDSLDQEIHRWAVEKWVKAKEIKQFSENLASPATPSANLPD